MIKQSITAVALLLLFACKENKPKEEPATMTEKETPAMTETKDNWEVLFDGTNTDAWHTYGEADDVMPEQWKIEGGVLIFKPDGSSGHNIVTDETFTNFELTLDWNISEGGNSGIMWAVQELPEYEEPYMSGPEIQVLDNERHPDAKAGKTHQAGALYDLVAPAFDDAVNPAGEWNHFVIRIDHNENKGSVDLNGKRVVEFPVHGEEWDNMVANSKFKAWEAFGKSESGKICLQDHGNEVAFKNIKIKRL
ncbi:3-keto-disaccharide hydrolase [Robertkochia solimangrovi]|uniref:3-keto-disaccharide hydrolase n=1 Tax=Robertkochia solimangrovi TaxID=2213046 RepID=UPI001180C3D9|nr:DUF1080 domain-containing protein [Robertkochia solimangrovi]TRZ46278.1 DUF1080 domain-containing protein [Robertkochia solimangrovi]